MQHQHGARKSVVGAPGRGRHLRHAADPHRRRVRGHGGDRGHEVVAHDRRRCCFGATLLLALHTSHVRGKIIRIVGVLVVVAGRLERRPRGARTTSRSSAPVTSPSLLDRRDAGGDPATGSSGTRSSTSRRSSARSTRTCCSASRSPRSTGCSTTSTPHFFAQGAASGRQVPLLQLRRHHDARLRRSHPAHGHRAGARQPRGAARPDLPRDGRRGARREPRSRRARRMTAAGTSTRPTTSPTTRTDARASVSRGGRRTGTSSRQAGAILTTSPVCGAWIIMPAADVEADVVVVRVEDDDVAGLELVPRRPSGTRRPASRSSGPCSRPRRATRPW